MVVMVVRAVAVVGRRRRGGGVRVLALVLVARARRVLLVVRVRRVGVSGLWSDAQARPLRIRETQRRGSSKRRGRDQVEYVVVDVHVEAVRRRGSSLSLLAAVAAAAATTTKTADTTGTRGETARSRSSSNNKGSEEPEAARERERERARDAEVLLQRRRETERDRDEPPLRERTTTATTTTLLTARPSACQPWLGSYLVVVALTCLLRAACLPAAARRHPAASARASSWGKQGQVGPRPKFLCARDRERAREIVLPRPERTINPSSTRFKVAADSFDSAPSETDRTPPR